LSRQDVVDHASTDLLKNRFRVLYDFDLQEQMVFILAIGVQGGNRLLVAKTGV